MELEEKLEKLGEYGSLLNDEFGEYMLTLFSLRDQTDYMSKKFLEDWSEEVAGCVEHIEEAYNIIEEEINIKRINRTLEYRG